MIVATTTTKTTTKKQNRNIDDMTGFSIAISSDHNSN